MTRWERLRARQLPTATLTLPARDGGEPERFDLRALLPEAWDELCLAHPPTEEQRAAGFAWNPTPFRVALIAASVLPLEGEEPLTVEQWDELISGGHLTPGDVGELFNTAYDLNDRTPEASTGKG